MGVPDEQEASDRWAVDHLFVDQDAVPTIVEVKRSGDTRIRRDVVGQMLDYAANGLAYWSVEQLRARFEAACERAGQESSSVLASFLQDNEDSIDFWQQVKTNLQAGRVRLIFVADVIPAELRRVIEFLNEQMDPAEVLGVEIRQYAGGDLKTLVPRVVGQTEQAQRKKSSTGPRIEGQWDETSFFDELSRQRPPEEVAVARALLAWARQQGLRIWWGKGRTNGSVFFMVDHRAEGHWTFALWTHGAIEIPFVHMQRRAPFASEGRPEALRDRLNQIDGIDLSADATSRMPTVPLAALVEESRRRDFLKVFDWVVDTVRSS